MTEAALEHLHLTVADAPRLTRLFKSIFGWRVRWQGPARDGGSIVHVGAARSYLALHTPMQSPGKLTRGRLQHVGVQVADLQKAEQAICAAGLVPYDHGDYDPGRRFYVMLEDGLELEVVSYRRAATAWQGFLASPKAVLTALK